VPPQIKKVKLKARVAVHIRTVGVVPGHGFKRPCDWTGADLQLFIRLTYSVHLSTRQAQRWLRDIREAFGIED